MRRFEGNMKEMGSIGCFTCVLVSEIKSDGVYQCAPSLAGGRVTYEPKLRPTTACQVGLYFLSNSCASRHHELAGT